MASGLGTLELAHQFIRAHVKAGDKCIDATCGRGRDTALLCELAGPSGKVLAFDLQPAAIAATKALLAARGQIIFEGVSEVSGAIMTAMATTIVNIIPVFAMQAQEGKMFHPLAFTKTFALLKPGGVVSMCIYYGRNNGYAERDALLAAVAKLDPERFTVLRTEFVNRTGEPPIAVFIIKE